MVLGSVGWDMKESPESNLHVCGKDDTKIAYITWKNALRESIGTLVQFLF